MEEWTRMLQGEDVQVNPADNDQLHIMDHNRRLAEAQADPDHDPEAYARMVQHEMEHMQQIRHKQIMAELTSRLVQSLGSGQGGLRDGSAPVSLQNLHQQVGQMIGAPGSEPAAQPGQPAKPAQPKAAA
jgi:hypothetical protein